MKFKNKFIIFLTIILSGSLYLTPIAQASTSTTKAQEVIVAAEKYLGTPYRYGGTTFSGIDCSALIQNAFRAEGISVPRTSRAQYNIGRFVPASQLKPGDLVFFSFVSNHQVSHVGIYIGDGKFINATSHKGVTITKFSSYWWNAYVGAKRVI